LACEPGVAVRYATEPSRLADADLVVLPGTRATVADLAWLRSRGLDHAVLAHAAAGKPVLGICGGFQMLGRTVRDPAGVEGTATEVDGLGLLDVETDFVAEKALRLPTGAWAGTPASGYEIHHGRITALSAAEEFLGGVRQGPVFGTMWHGALEGDALRARFLEETLGIAASGVSFPDARERRIDLLGDLVEQHLDVDALLDLAHRGAPAGLPFLPPGAP
jgi:adenosylcobyric acid synthase